LLFEPPYKNETSDAVLSLAFHNKLPKTIANHRRSRMPPPLPEGRLTRAKPLDSWDPDVTQQVDKNKGGYNCGDDKLIRTKGITRFQRDQKNVDKQKKA